MPSEPVLCESCGELVSKLVKCLDEDGCYQEWCQTCADMADDIVVQRAQEHADLRGAEKKQRGR